MQENILTERKANIGILTFHYAHNFGAVLQAYALKKYIESIGYECQILDYRNNKIKERYARDLPLNDLLRKRDYFCPWRWKNIKKAVNVKQNSQLDWERQYDEFDRFINVYLKPVPFSKYYRCSSIFFGSDQIWNTGITGKNETVYWGDLPGYKGNKVSYAASLYSKQLTKVEEANIRKYLLNFYSISVREESIKNVIAKISGRNDIVSVVDPTLLVEKNVYIPFVKQEKEEYVLVYMVSYSDELIRIAKKFGKKVKVLWYYNSIDISEIELISYAGPEKFLSLIYCADLIITNSFHGTVFSIIFEKKFTVVYDENERITNLLSWSGLKRAHCKGAESFTMQNIVEPKTADQSILKEKITESQKFILNGCSIDN